MAMAWIWTGMATVSLIFAAWNGTMDAVGAAALEGAGAAVQLCIAMAGVLCLWSGVMEIMSRCGLSGKLAALLRPALRRLLPRASRDPETLAAVSANVSANLLYKAAVDFLHNLIYSGKQSGEQINRPLFQRFRHNGMVGVSAGAGGNIPCFIPGKIIVIQQNSHQFGNCTVGWVSFSWKVTFSGRP